MNSVRPEREVPQVAKTTKVNPKGNKKDFYLPVAVTTAMEEFAVRVLNGEEGVYPEEVVILPDILKLLAKNCR